MAEARIANDSLRTYITRLHVCIFMCAGRERVCCRCYANHMALLFSTDVFWSARWTFIWTARILSHQASESRSEFFFVTNRDSNHDNGGVATLLNETGWSAEVFCCASLLYLYILCAYRWGAVLLQQRQRSNVLYGQRPCGIVRQGVQFVAGVAVRYATDTKLANLIIVLPDHVDFSLTDVSATPITWHLFSPLQVTAARRIVNSRATFLVTWISSWKCHEQQQQE